MFDFDLKLVIEIGKMGVESVTTAEYTLAVNPLYKVSLKDNFQDIRAWVPGMSDGITL